MSTKAVPIGTLLDPEEYANEQIVMAIEGTITKLFPVKKGDGANGPYEFQNGEFTGADGKMIRIVFASNTQDMAARGKKVTIRSVKSAAHGFQGIKVIDKEWEKDGKTMQSRELKITGSAEITYAGGAPSGGSSGGADKPQGGTTGQANNGGGMKMSDTHPLVALKDMLECHVHIATMIEERYAPMSPEFRQGATQTLFIEAARSGLIPAFSDRVKKPVPIKYPPPPKDPKQWKECYIRNEKSALNGKTLEEVPDEDLLKLFSYYDEKSDNSPFAECVYQAARDRDILPKNERTTAPPRDPDLDPDAEDDIPF